MFPAFSDQQTQPRFRRLERRLNGAGRAANASCCAEVDNAAWLLGVNFTVQVVPAAGDRVLHVVAGQSDAVRRRGRQLYRAAWSWPVAHRPAWSWRPSKAVPAQQTWENVGRALQAAGKLVEAEGAIAVCCDLAASSRAGVQRMACGRRRNLRLRHGRPRSGRADALPAAQLARALQRDKVYLLSRLDPSVVEELDIIPLAGPDELARLARRHRRASCFPMPSM